MGNCISSQNKQQKDDFMDQSVYTTSDDIPFDERTKEQRMYSQTKQMIKCMERNGEI